MAETVLTGRSASPGLAIGPLVRLADVMEADAAPVRAPAQEQARLAAAVEQAKAELAALVEGGAEDESAILAFQLELLADPALLAPAGAAIVRGTPAAAPPRRGRRHP